MRGLLLLALLIPARSLTRPRHPSGTTDANGSAAAQQHAGRRKGRHVRAQAHGPVSEVWRPTRDLPAWFAKKWAKEHEYDAQTGPTVTGEKNFSRHGDGIKLVVGIPMIQSQVDVHEAHLQTWVTGKGVCHRDDYNRPDCHIFPVFLFGNTTDAARRARNASKHALCLPAPEPDMSLDDGYYHPEDERHRYAQRDADIVQFVKPYLWFKLASGSYPWATHIAKMDADTYPHFAGVLRDLAAGPAGSLYYGALYGQTDQSCGTGFMQGALYAISANLQPCMDPVVTERCPPKYWDFVTFGSRGWKLCPGHPLEDKYFGKCLFHASHQAKCPPLTCMDTRPTWRWDHPCCRDA